MINTSIEKAGWNAHNRILKLTFAVFQVFEMTGEIGSDAVVS
jgi:hypothetical protein